MSTSNPTFRYPFVLAGQPKEVQDAHVWAYNAILDLQLANQTTAAKIKTLQGTSSTASTASSTVVSAASETIITVPSTAGAVNNQTGNTSYTTQQSDNGAFLLFSSGSPIAVSLSILSTAPAVTLPWSAVIFNLGTGTVTLTPAGGTISYPNHSAAANMPILAGDAASVAFDGTNFWAVTFPVPPQTIAAVTHQWLNSYTASTGVFTQSQPAFTDISGQITTSQLPASGLSVTITTAKLTTGGTNGSMTFTNGILTAQTPAT